MDRKSRNLFEVVAQGYDVNLQRLLLEGKEERNVATLAHGNTVLHEAAWNGFSRCVKILCNVYPKDLDENSNKEKLGWKKIHFVDRVNFCGFSALHLAAQNGHNQTLRELLYAGCSTSIHNDYGDTALHTACRYGHAGVVRILISAKCDVDAFNLNHDTPLHITCAMGRRKLTKLLLEAGAMQFQNLQHETPRDIAQRKNLTEILEIMKNFTEKMEKRMIREAARNSKSPSGSHHPQPLPHSSKMKYNGKSDQQNPRNWSPYGCHYYPDTRNFPTPNLESLPKDPLQKGEQYYMDLGGNIRKGPVGNGNKCYCVPLDKNATPETCRNAQKYVDKTNEKLDRKITALASRIEKTERKAERKSCHERSNENEAVDPLYPLLRIVGDKNKQLHLKKWLAKVYADGHTEAQQSYRDKVKHVAVDVHRESVEKPEISAKVTRSDSRKMPTFDENGNKEQKDENDDSYTDISNASEGESGNGSIDSINGNCLYDESFLRQYQQQQTVQAQQNDSMTSPSVASNQNIEIEMEKITKSLLLDDSGLMVNRNPDVIKDHIHHSAKRSTKKIKSAITMPTMSASGVLASGDLYVNSFFSEGGRHDEVGSKGIDELISKVRQTVVNSSNVSTVSSSTHQMMKRNLSQDERSAQRGIWNRPGRSRNPLPLDIDEIEKCAENIFASNEVSDEPNMKTSLSENNFVLLDQLLKARKKFNHSYQQQLELMNQRDAHLALNLVPSNDTHNGDFTIPSSSTLV